MVKGQYRRDKRRCRWFESNPSSQDLASIAQLVEHLTCNEDVGGSIPSGGSTKLKGALKYPNNFNSQI